MIQKKKKLVCKIQEAYFGLDSVIWACFSLRLVFGFLLLLWLFSQMKLAEEEVCPLLEREGSCLL